MGHLVAQGPTVMLIRESLPWWPLWPAHGQEQWATWWPRVPQSCSLETLYLGGHSGQLMARHNGPLGGPGPHGHAPVTEVDISVADPTVY
jgi:hypothetical protein